MDVLHSAACPFNKNAPSFLGAHWNHFGRGPNAVHGTRLSSTSPAKLPEHARRHRGVWLASAEIKALLPSSCWLGCRRNDQSAMRLVALYQGVSGCNFSPPAVPQSKSK